MPKEIIDARPANLEIDAISDISDISGDDDDDRMEILEDDGNTKDMPYFASLHEIAESKRSGMFVVDANYTKGSLQNPAALNVNGDDID